MLCGMMPNQLSHMGQGPKEVPYCLNISKICHFSLSAPATLSPILLPTTQPGCPHCSPHCSFNGVSKTKFDLKLFLITYCLKNLSVGSLMPLGPSPNSNMPSMRISCPASLNSSLAIQPLGPQGTGLPHTWSLCLGPKRRDSFWGKPFLLTVLPLLVSLNLTSCTLTTDTM